VWIRFQVSGVRWRLGVRFQVPDVSGKVSE